MTPELVEEVHSDMEAGSSREREEEDGFDCALLVGHQVLPHVIMRRRSLRHIHRTGACCSCFCGACCSWKSLLLESRSSSCWL